MNAKEILKVYFGYDFFREGQERIINSILAGRDAFAIMPTGAGKSVCYQVPALMLSGITIVISPLISLMQDQVKALNDAGVRATFINSSLTDYDIRMILDGAANDLFKIIYIAPERLESGVFIDFANKVDISMVTVDEAHCISQWGQDFRPSYLKIVDFVNGLKRCPVISAFTATATEEVKTDIACILGLKNPNIVVTGFDRANLYYKVESTKNKDDFVMEYIDSHREDSGIIYCSTRKSVDTVHEILINKGIPTTKYHAGIDNETRKKSQDDFIYDRIPIIIATNAFGMGIDKSNVRYVIHYNMPQSMESYYQEAGRAGRDGEPAQCILLFSAKDVMIQKYLLEHKDFMNIPDEDVELIKQRDIRRLQIMENYCRTTRCLRNYILDYFGEKTGKSCDNCGNCHREYKEIDMTKEAKWVINCLAETKGRYGLNIVLGTLLGANRARLSEIGAVKYKSYARLKNCSESDLRLLISQMLLDGYIYQTEDHYSVLKMGDYSALKDENTHVIIRKYEEKEPEKVIRSESKRSTDLLTGAGYALFEKLRILRKKIAEEEAIPPYIVFSDKSLIDMCIRLPRNREQMLNVFGVGVRKHEKYGDRFIDEIKVFVDNHPDAITSINGVENDEGLEEKSNPERKSNRKLDFHLEKSDVSKFKYREFYYISEIKDELNRICTAENTKKVTNKVIWEFLVEEDYTEELEEYGRLVKMHTYKGLKAGIKTVKKINPVGIPYTLLVYPISVQQLIVEHFAHLKESILGIDEESGNDVHIKRLIQSDNLGVVWTDEEDEMLKQLFDLGVSTKGIAIAHRRNVDAIRARLKKHKLIE